jgi:hypothetical protein
MVRTNRNRKSSRAIEKPSSESGSSCLNADSRQASGESLKCLTCAAEAAIAHRLPGPTPPVPKWDPLLRELSVGDVVVAAYRKHPARNQTSILEVFQRNGWPVGIDSPVLKAELNQTLKDLNRKIQPKLIRFRGNGTGEVILWERVDQPNQTDR